MLPLSELKKISIRKVPYGQKIFAKYLAVNYRFPPRTHIEVEGWENIPDEPCYLAMNHTDSYNYWPFQYELACRKNQYTCTWVKAKYFRNWFVRHFLLQCNNIPVASKGVLIARSVQRKLNRKPSNEEYRVIRNFLDTGTLPETLGALQPYFGQQPQTVIKEIENEFSALSHEVIRLNREAFQKGHHILIFPQGTRSKRLSKGHIGLVQMSQCLKVPIVPIGCSGSDLVYPGSAPWAKGGHIRYRIGKPITLDDPKIQDFIVQESFLPFSAHAHQEYRTQFQSMTNVIMDIINTLVDPPYQYSEDQSSDGVKGLNRFM